MSQDSESIDFSISEETVTGSRHSIYLKEDSLTERIKWRRVIKKFSSWRVFKTIVFILSLISVIIQSMEFFKIYYKYPTNIVLQTTVEKDFKLPAVTMCFTMTISTEVFCRFNSQYCEKPSNLEEFCKKHPIYCGGNASSLRIPMTGYYTNYSEKVLAKAHNYIIYEHFNDKELYDISKQGNTPLTRTFILDSSVGLLKCYSENLHLYQNALKPETSEIDFNSSSGFRILRIRLNLHKIRLFYIVSKPQVFIGIHSPFVPNNPTIDGQPISSGKMYEFQVELEREEHRLPPPYQTNCLNNGPSEEAVPLTNPNSYQMCLEMCKSAFSTKVYDCNMALTMVSSTTDLCFQTKYGEIPKRSYLKKPLKELKKERHICMQNCRPECLKLQYKYKVAEKDLYLNLKETNDYAFVDIFVKNTEITVLRHVPLYGDMIKAL
ncbi:unnamed protein product [Larinioides sclopetarius]|uniref:Uncharacterized protein n=1 Tax=Larinioides sclopetarius TaxID=280406 RepID=A0AAV2B332_9ARAC